MLSSFAPTSTDATLDHSAGPSTGWHRHHAPAKINLALHVVGQRAYGHHLLESLVAFANIGDTLDIALSEMDTFAVSGPFAAGLPLSGEAAGGNLVLRARDLLRAECLLTGQAAPPVAVHLDKALPVASGIGGGSADAAAALKGLMALWGVEIAPDMLMALALSLGADLPMCLHGRPLVARGIGERIEPLEGFPALPLVLVNPLVGVSTPAVFKALQEKINPPLPGLPDNGTPDAWLSALAGMRNDLQPPATVIEPAITDVCDALAAAGAGIVRMSGSGATCFGVFTDDGAAQTAARALQADHPGWYVRACRTVA